MALKDRIRKLERGSVPMGDIEQAQEIFAAFVRVSRNPSSASEANHALLASNCWQRAMLILVDAAGGLGVVVRESMKIATRSIHSAAGSAPI